MLTVRQRRSAQARAEAVELIADLGVAFCASFLDVHPSTIQRWLDGRCKPPRAVLIALRAAKGILPGMDVRHWEGWIIGKDGLLYAPGSTRGYHAGHLLAMPLREAQLVALQNRVRELEEKLARAARGHPAANDGDLSVQS